MKFIDPRIDFAFKKIFGSEDAKDILISFLESLLGLEGDRCIAELAIMDPFLVPRLKDLKSTILDVRCKDHRGISYIVEMHVEKVSSFLKRIQYNSAKAYANQISRGEDYPNLKQIIAVTITDFILFDDFEHCTSVHESRETVHGQSYLTDIVH
ncbi:MAG: Rpn family recombination-promoting nuclease/putative transposase, partial [Magnetococcales bacterium]|nr:Rpn family recombination-promoting nuclease/putative transposase [Magnetococcales bacterium]